LDVKVHHRVDEPRKLEIHSHAVITASQVEAADLAEWSNFQDALQVTYRVPVLIKSTRDPADIPLLTEVCAKSPADARSAIALVELYLSEQKIPEAQKLLEAARAASPDERKLWELSLVAVDQIDDQERVYRSMLAQFPDDAKIAVELAQNLIDQDRPSDAQKVLKPLIAHKQPAIRAAALIELAHCSVAREEPRKALRQLALAHEADAGGFSADAWFLKGQIHESLYEHRLALEAFRQVLEAEESADALEAAARMALAVDRKSEASDFWRRLAVAAEGDPEYLARSADLAIRLGRFGDAFDFASQALIGENEWHPLAHRPMGLAHLHRGEFEQAIRHLSMSDIDTEVLIALVQAQIALGRLADAEKQIARFNAIVPTNESRKTVDWIKSLADRRLSAAPRVIAASSSDSPRSAPLDRAICAEALDARGLWPNQVRRLLNDALNEKDPSATAFGLRAVLRMRRGDLSAAMRDADHALAMNPNDANARHVRGKVRLERGDKNGLTDLELAAQLSARRNARILHDLAWAYAAANRHAEALAAQREAAMLRPEDPVIDEQLTELERATRAHEKAPALPGR
jgi:tetratricopeptide (TPR) repeat protein